MHYRQSTLNGITILDFSRLLPGPLATNLLAQMGARVIKVEHPDHPDYVRQQPPHKDGESTLFHALNFAKECRSIDPSSEKGRKEIETLVAESDVVVEQFRPGVMEARGLGYEALRAIQPQLIYLSLSGYGQDGPYREKAGHDLNYLAYSGLLSLCRDAEGRPVIPGIQIADIAGGSYMLLSACLSALLHRERTGEGSYVDLSMLDGLMPLLTVPASQYWGGADPYEMNFLSGALVNYNVYECSDGRWVALGALEIKFWNRFCKMVNKPEWERSHPLELSTRLFPYSELKALFKLKPRREWMALAEGKDVCLSPVRTIEEIEEDPQIRHRNSVQSLERAGGQDMKGFKIPFRMEAHSTGPNKTSTS